MSGSERSIARSIGATKPTVRRAIQSLVESGEVKMRSSKQGTLLSVVGASSLEKT